MKKTFAILLAIALAAPLAPGLAADKGDDSAKRPKPHFTILEDAYETERLSLAVGPAGTGTLSVPRVGGGDATLKVTGNTRLLVQGKQRPLRELAGLANRGATVFAKAKTDQVVRIEVY